MKLNKADLPYLYEDASAWEVLPNGVEKQVVWEYAINEASYTISFDDREYPLIIERIRHRQQYRFEDYFIAASAVDEWRYVDKPDLAYSSAMQGYRGYWEGECREKDTAILQPEVGVLLVWTGNSDEIPPYIETISKEALVNLMNDAQRSFADDDSIAFSHPLPVGIPRNAPESVNDAQRRMRAITRLQTTRGRASLLEMMMNATGIIAGNGGWRILPEEVERRHALGLGEK